MVLLVRVSPTLVIDVKRLLTVRYTTDRQFAFYLYSTCDYDIQVVLCDDVQFDSARLFNALTVLSEHSLIRVSRYTLVDRTAIREVTPTCVVLTTGASFTLEYAEFVSATGDARAFASVYDLSGVNLDATDIDATKMVECTDGFYTPQAAAMLMSDFAIPFVNVVRILATSTYGRARYPDASEYISDTQIRIAFRAVFAPTHFITLSDERAEDGTREIAIKAYPTPTPPCRR